MIKFITLYESGTTDGYTTNGNGRYFRTHAEAMKDVEKQGGHARVIEHKGCFEFDDVWYEVKSRAGFCLAKTKDEEAAIKKNALEKLTPLERKLLGIKDEH